MEALLHYGPTVLTFIIVLAVLVLAHEFGHYITARLFGMDVDEFGFGFPPRLFGKKWRGTLWSVNLIPLGGFVRIKGEDDPSKAGPGSFAEKSLGARAAVICAGVAMNLVLASLLFSAVFMLGIPQVRDGLPANARVSDPRVQVLEAVEGYPAAEAGLRAGDVIEAVAGLSFDDIASIQDRVNAAAGEPVALTVRRGDETFGLELAPRLSDETGRYIIGVALVETAIVSFPWHIALWKGAVATVFYVREIFAAFGDLIRSLFVQEAPSVEFSGPVGIAVLTGRVAQLGFVHLLQFMALLSVNLAVINILPIPALDGGRMLFILIERFRGKAVRPYVEAAIHRLAFILLLLLILLVTIQDLERYKTQIVNVLKAVFGVT